MNKKYLKSLLSLLIVLFMLSSAKAQRVYSDSTKTNMNGLCIGCNISNEKNAIDTNRNNYSSINATLGLLGAYAEQRFYFPSTGKRGDTVVVEVGFPNTLVDLGVLKNIYLETGNGSVSNGDRSSVFRSLVALRLLSGNKAEFTFRATESFNWASLRMDASIAGLLNSIRIYNAYYANFTGTSTPGACNNGIAYQVESSTLCLACNVSNPQYVIDNIDSNYATINTTVGALGGYTQETIIFEKSSKLGDTINIILRDKSVLLSATLLKNIEIATYNGNTFNYDRTEGNSQLLNVKLFYSGYLTLIQYVPNTIFDRVEIRVNSGIATVLPQIDLMTVCKKDGNGSTNPNDPNDPFGNKCTAPISQTSGVNNLCLLCSVSNPEYVTDANPNNYSQLNTPVGLLNAYAYQTLTFPSKANAGDSVLFLFGVSQKLASVSVLSNVTIRSYNGIIPNNDDTVMNINLLSLLSDSSKFTYLWKAKKTFDRVEIRLNSGVAGVLNNFRIFTACLKTDGTGNVPESNCEDSDSTTTNTFGLCIGCGVSNAKNVVDSIATNYSTLNLTVSVLNAGVYQNVILDKEACKNDSVTVVIENPAGLLSAKLLGGTEVRLYNGNTLVQTKTIDVTLLTLLPQGGNVRAFTFAASGKFDRVQLRVSGGLVGAISDLRFYGVCVKPIAPPKFSATNYTICSGSDITINGTVPTGAHIEWFATATSTTLLDTGAFTLKNVTKDTVFYAQARYYPDGCPSNVRIPVYIFITNKPSNPIVTNPISVCAGGTVTITPQPFGGNFSFYTDSIGGTPFASGSSYKLGPVFRDTSLYIQTKVGLCMSSNRVKAEIKINNFPLNNINTADTITLCKGNAVTITVKNPLSNAVYNWYNQPFSGTSIYSGNPFTSGIIANDTAFYVEATDSVCGSSLVRARTIVLVEDTVAISLDYITKISCFSDTIKVEAKTTTPNAIIKWYASASSTSALFTGSSYSFVPTKDTTELFVEATSNGCIASKRLSMTVYRQGFPDGFAKVNDTFVCKNNAVTLTAETNVPSSTIKWYDAFVNGNLLHTGDTYSTPNLNKTTIYYVDFSSTTCNPKGRKPVSVTVVDSVLAPVAFCDSVTNNYIRFGFTNVVGASSYEVSIDGGAFVPATLANNKFEVTGLTANQSRTIRVRAISPCGSGIISFPVKCTTNNCPPAPTPVCDSTSSDYIRFAWNPITGATSYEVSINGGAFVTSNLASAHEITGLTFGQSATISVRTVAPGCTSQAASITVTCNTSPCPTAPSNLTCDSVSATSIIFTWNEVSGATSYEVSIDGGPFVAANMPPNKHEVTGLANNQSVSIRVRNVAPGCINQTPSATATCTTLACPKITANLNLSLDVCRGEDAKFIISNISIPNYTIVVNGVSQSNDPNIVISKPQVSRLYDVIIYDPNNIACDSFTGQIQINVNPIPTVDFTFTYINPSNAGFSKEVQFISNATGATDWFWEFGDGDSSHSQNPYHMYPTSSKYTVTHRVTNAFGCSNSITKIDTVNAYPGGDLFVPNSFSPDNNGVNDLFKVYGDNVILESLKVFNQFGNKMFETNDMNVGWNGEFNALPQPGGVYIWTAIVIDRFGNKEALQGTVTLSRSN